MLWCTITQSTVGTAQVHKAIQKRLQRSRQRLYYTRRRLLQWRIDIAAMVFLALALVLVSNSV